MIEVTGLTKRYGNHTAVSDLSFTVESGQIYGFLGPNGAGKSTTMNIMTGCLSATSGSVVIDGFDIFEEPEKAKRKIGYLPEIPPLYTDMTPYEYLCFVAEAKGVKNIEQEVAHALEKTGTCDVKDRLIKNLSKGYKQRVGIAQAIMGNPSIIILDEPTVGLDPQQIIEIRELILDLGKEHTVILSSHILSEVQAVCDKILIIANGKLAACDTPENLEKLFAGTVTMNIIAHATEEETAYILNATGGISVISVESRGEETFAEVEYSAETDMAERIFFAFADAKKAIVHMSAQSASLEDIFIELTSDNVNEEPVLESDVNPEEDAEVNEDDSDL